MKIIRIILPIVCVILLAGCTATDPFGEDAYFGDIYSNGVLINPVGGVGDMVKATYDPANISQQLVGLSAAQSLTNKNLTMNNNIPIYWKTAGGIPQASINLIASNILQITNPTSSVQISGGSINLNTAIDEEIYLWGNGVGTGRELVLYGSSASAINTLRDSPTINMGAYYWDAGAGVGWAGTIIHDMITAGAAPKSQLKFSINNVPILRLENNNGVVKTFSDGALQIGGVANYTLFAADGKQTMVGTARVEKDVVIPLTSFGKGVAAPATVYIGNYIGYEYTINDTAYFSTEVPYDWDSTSDLEIELHWYIDEAYATAPNGEVRWNLIYTATKEDGSETVDAATATIDSGDINIPATAKRLVQTELSIPAASLQAHDVIGIQVKRIALVGGNNPTAKPTLIGAMIQYISNKLGE